MTIAAIPGFKVYGASNTVPINASADDWIQAAGYDFSINRSPVTYDANGYTRTMSDRFVLNRSDTGAPLSVVSSRFNELQPADTMRAFHKLSADAGLTLSGAGVAGDGRKMWAIATHNGDRSINGDAHAVNVLFATGCDGQTATVARGTALRYACENLLSTALRRADGNSVRFKHSVAISVEQMFRLIAEVLGLIDFEQSWNAFHDQMRALQDLPVNMTEAEEIFSNLLAPQRKAPARQALEASAFSDLMAADFGGAQRKAETDKSSRAIRGLETLMESYTSAPGACPGTGYGVVQGMSHYIDHVRGVSDDKRLTSSLFGQGETLKARTVEAVSERLQ